MVSAPTPCAAIPCAGRIYSSDEKRCDSPPGERKGIVIDDSRVLQAFNCLVHYLNENPVFSYGCALLLMTAGGKSMNAGFLIRNFLFVFSNQLCDLFIALSPVHFQPGCHHFLSNQTQTLPSRYTFTLCGFFDWVSIAVIIDATYALNKTHSQ